MGETWRRVVIGSALLVYLTGLGCAGGILIGHMTRGADTKMAGLFTIDSGRVAVEQGMDR
jgi:hypothetical protein